MCSWAFIAGTYVNGSEQPKRLTSWMDEYLGRSELLPQWLVLASDGDRNGLGSTEFSTTEPCGLGLLRIGVKSNP